MFDWLRSVFRSAESQERQGFLEEMDALNAGQLGGDPTVVERVLGRLATPSRTLVIGDPQEMPSIERNVVKGLLVEEVVISAALWRYPSGRERVVALRITLEEHDSVPTVRRLGQLGIDSGKVVLADQADVLRHWMQVGPDRIGKISTARNDNLKRLLTKRFGLTISSDNGISAVVAEPISAELEAEIERFLKSIPEYAAFPVIYFRVKTNDSFDRVNDLEKPWAFLPIGTAPSPTMFASETGRGDGCYTIQGVFAQDRLCEVRIDFLEEPPDESTIDEPGN